MVQAKRPKSVTLLVELKDVPPAKVHEVRATVERAVTFLESSDGLHATVVDVDEERKRQLWDELGGF
jgi:hypothetical protein